MLFIAYCLRKGWSIKDVSTQSYRQDQLPLDVHHDDKAIFEEKNDFVAHKSELIDDQEDDLDNLNLDI